MPSGYFLMSEECLRKIVRKIVLEDDILKQREALLHLTADLSECGTRAVFTCIFQICYIVQPQFTQFTYIDEAS